MREMNINLSLPIILPKSEPLNDQDMANDKDQIEILSIKKNTRLTHELPKFDDEFYRWKKNYWKERIKDIKYIVAPMVDQSELAFRMMLRDNGAHLCYTPMIHAHLFVNDLTYRKTAFTTFKHDRPLIVQFCANEPKTFLNACRLVEGYCDGVDLNLGCPQLIAKRGNYGSYLQERPDLITSMISLVYTHCRLPLSVKIRVLNDIDATIKYAKMIENSGASMLAVHGRNRDQRGVNTGLANWAFIRAVKNVLDIPVIANGNLQMPYDISNCLESTKVDAVMSAEGILSNPFLFRGINSYSFDVALTYLDYAKSFKADSSSIRAHLFRICHYSFLKFGDLRERNAIVTTVDDYISVIEELKNRCLIEIEEKNAINQKWEEIVRKSYPNSTSLLDLINSTPHYFCKPYIRPSSSESNIPSTPYREERRAYIEKVANETGLSKRQIRKREKRKIEEKKTTERKTNYPRCVKCYQPAGINCQNLSCRKCCKFVCIRKLLDCRVHGFGEKMADEKRKAYCERHGLTLDELVAKNIETIKQKED